MTLYEQLAKTRVLPLYTATDLTYLPVVESLLIEHELPFIEVTFRSDLALADERQLFIVDPMLATGGSAIMAIDALKKRGASNMKFVCLVAAPEGVKALQDGLSAIPKKGT